ncbi:MAG: hypothetical protein HYX20_04120 [Candidatus Yanofskybacteria bacterium]|nr:hypothetical protein [Candidatus Yanofskybacteria bacterium]
MEKIIKPKMENREAGEQEETIEGVTKLGHETLEKEVAATMPPHRKAGYMLTTFLAMGLALSFPTKAEAQFGIGGRGLGSRITRDVLTAGKNAFEMSQNKKIIQIHAEYQEKLEKLREAEGRMDEEYHRQKLEFREKNDEGALKQLEEEYRQGKTKIAQARVKLDRERDLKLAKTKAIRDAVGGGIGTVRGY